jgi:tetratricopeptide (TPR) repeat protein
LTKIGRTDEAMGHYRKAMLLKPDYPGVYFNMALMYDQIGQPNEAVKAAKKALDLARSTGQTLLAGEFQQWLNSYRAGSPDSRRP